ncbi:MAG: DUF2808 domain-containing protein [Leptolyngbya sp. BL-A-14]
MSHSSIPAYFTLKRDASGTLARARFAQTFAITAGLVISSSLSAASATQIASDRFVFDRAPRLVSVSTTQPSAFANDGTYQFTLRVPEDLGAPLQAVTISQADNPGKIQFALDRSQVVANGATVPISAIGGENSDETTIAFATPIQPGSTVTLSLLVNRNPGADGIYLFGVTAYPVGNSTDGLFLGYGRVALYSNER